LVVGLLSPVYGASLVAAVATLVFIVAQPVLGLALLTAVIPLTPSGDLLAGLPVTPADGLVVALLVTFAASRAIRRQFALTVTGAFWPGVAFIVAMFISAVVAADPATSGKELLRWCETLGVLIVTATLCRTERARITVVSVVLLATIGEAVLGWVQFILRRGPDGFLIGSFLRAYGTFGQPNPFGGYLVMTLPIALGLVLWQWPRGPRPTGWTIFGMAPTFVLAGATAGIGVIALLMSLSRGALLGLVAAGLLLLCLFTRKGIVLVAFGLIGSAILVTLGASNVLPGIIADRLSQIWEFIGPFDASRVVPTPENWAIVERMAHWQAAWNMYQASPIVGIGPGGYVQAYPLYRVNDFWTDPLGHAHNLYLNIMAETGFIGIATYLGQWTAWIVVVSAGFRRSRGRFDRALAAGVVASLVGVALHNIFDNLSVHGLETETGLLVGLAAAIGRPAARGPDQEVA
jgi:putative inorganic carbon (HCO3(-)) transporter